MPRFKRSIRPYNRDSFTAAIAFYPYCLRPMNDSNAPLLILIGEKDDWCPAEACAKKMPVGQPEVILQIYPGAYHDFDWEGIDTIVSGHRLLYDPAATDDAIIQIESFLSEHF